MTTQDYRVELDAYHGPLDLLLFLVKRHEIDLYDIPIATLTDQYLEHLRDIQRIDMDVAGEFLLMAATLVEIKSQMLLPRPEEAEGEESDALSELDPRYELVQQLLAYKAYKDAAHQLDDRRDEWQRRFAHTPARPRPRNDAQTNSDAEDAEEIEFDLEDANVMDLCEAFGRLLESIGRRPRRHEVSYDETPIGLHAADILDRVTSLGEGGKLSLQEIFVGRRGRSEMIGLFLATLELVNQKKVKVKQDRIKGEIFLVLPTEEDIKLNDPDRQPDWRDPETGEVEYAWPNEEVRQRAERRAAIRAKRRFAKPGEDVEEDDVIDLDEVDSDEDEFNVADEEEQT